MKTEWPWILAICVLLLADAEAQTIRLVGSRSQDRGRVEIFHNGRWGTVCDDGWDHVDATVVCKSLGYREGQALSGAYFGAGSGQIWLDDVDCESGMHSSLEDCEHEGWGESDCSHRKDASVRCFRDEETIRLAGSGSASRGRVEIYHNNQWGTVCDDYFDDVDATVVCRMLGFRNGTARKQAYFGRGSGPIFLDDVDCRYGNPSALQDCHHNGWGVENCGHGEDAGVECSDKTSWGEWTMWSDCSVTCGNGTQSRTRQCDVYLPVIPGSTCTGDANEQRQCNSRISCVDEYTVRLVGSRSADKGRVEIYYNNQWGTVCDDGWDDVDATVVCRTLGYRDGIALTQAYFGEGSGPIFLDDVDCHQGNPSSLQDCQHRGWGVENCDHSEDAGVKCSNNTETIRLVGSRRADRGRVEIYHNNQWGTVCDDGWDDIDATVVCRTLGYRNGTAFKQAHFGEGTGPIFLDDVDCQYGNPSSLQECQHNGWGVEDCSHSEDAGVECSGISHVRLVGSNRSDSGRVEVYHSRFWGTICDDDWDDVDATVICKMLGFLQGQAVGSAYFGEGTGKIWLDNIDCSQGPPQDISNCEHTGWGIHDCTHTEDAGVICYNAISWSVWSVWSDCSVTCGDGVRLRTRQCDDPVPASNASMCTGSAQEQEPCQTGVKCTDCKEHVDLAFVIDESGSVGESNFQRGLTFMNKVLEMYDIDINKSRVAVLTFGARYTIQFDFNTYSSKSDVTQAIRLIQYGKSWNTYTERAIIAVESILFKAARGDRPGVQNVCVVLTDGESSNTTRTIEAANILKNTGTHVFSIGIGDSVREEELIGIASVPSEKYYLQVDDYNTLQTDKMADIVSNRVCEAAGTWNNWKEWSPCSVSCGGGNQQRRRACADPSGSRPCEGDSNEYRPCDAGHCPVHGLWGSWLLWSSCSVSCGNGRRQRSRNCDNPVPSYGGNPCSGPSSEYRSCTTGKICPVHGSWSGWSGWSACSVTCGYGVTSRNRLCNNPAPANGGTHCTGLSVGQKSCWSGTLCSGDGSVRLRGGKVPDRGRVEIYHMNRWGSICKHAWGDAEATVACRMFGFSSGKVDTTTNYGTGVNTVWLDNVNCTSGEETDIRNCTHSGWGVTACGYQDYASVKCVSDCKQPVDLVFIIDESGSVGQTNFQKGLKFVENVMDVYEIGPNNTRVAVVTFSTSSTVVFHLGDFSNKSDILNATRNIKYSGGGTATARALNTARDVLVNTARGARPSVQDVCVVLTDGSSDSNSDTLSAAEKLKDVGVYIFTIGIGGSIFEQELKDIASSPPEQFFLNVTDYETLQTDVLSELVSSRVCEAAGTWNNWREWSPCTLSCGGGTQQRRRACAEPTKSRPCEGDKNEYRPCNSRPCPVDGEWNKWSGWSTCSVTCGNGIRRRTRLCQRPSPRFGGQDCLGNNMEEEQCETRVPCAVHGGWSTWGKWSRCSSTCGNGTQERSRTCNNPPPAHGGRQCPGSGRIARKCETSIKCPVDGGWSIWAAWSRCSSTCGTGTQERSRACNNPFPTHGGRQCPGSGRITRKCDTTVKCPVDGGWSIWIAWSRCSSTCGNGTQERSRACNNPSPAHGGRQCPGSDRITRKCDTTVKCPVDGGWSIWIAWSRCSSTCGNGTQERSRACNNPSPAHGGRQCPGSDRITRKCDTTVKCPVDGGWSIWAAWSRCSSTCGNGTQERSRACNNPFPAHRGRQCPGSGRITRKCHTTVKCPVDGGWSKWEDWSSCSVTCGQGTQERSRVCNNPSPAYGGRRCSGSSQTTRNCDTNVRCPVDGGWNMWEDWSSCSVTCGQGTQERSRVCNNPSPAHGGRHCSGSSETIRDCDTNIFCPVDGGWSRWADWGTCSVTCEIGTQERARICNNPSPMHGGRPCTGNTTATRKCDTAVPCPVDGGWSKWEDWSSCSVTCGQGLQERSRVCDNPTPAHGGRLCSGTSQTTRNCDTNMPCPVDGGWNHWEDWTSCSATCGIGTQERSRVCDNPSPLHGGKPCSGSATATKNCDTEVPCPVDGGWSTWDDWSSCSVTCEEGTQERSRVCNNPSPAHGGRICSGSSQTTRKCDTNVPCPVDGGWSTWADWGTCSATCEIGSQERSRMCNNPSPVHGGRNCTGSATATRECDASIPCPVHGGWSKWEDWSTCSVTCGEGTQERLRVCNNPSPAHGGRDCSGSPQATRNCDTNIPCPVDGSWTSWSQWSTCSRTCDEGLRERTRTCSDPAPAHGGNECQGKATESLTCEAGVLCPGSCAKDQFKCHSSTINNKQCVKLEFRCDFFPDCPDSSDEIDCNVSVGCPEGQFKCDNNDCVRPGSECDGVVDCKDGSDESEGRCGK